MKKKELPDTDLVRLEFLRTMIRKETESHGAPCGCLLCEALIFVGMSKAGEYSLTYNHHIPPLK